MLLVSVIALGIGALFAALWLASRLPGSALAALSWLLYAPYEYLMHMRVLCTGECNIRVDLLLIWPLLLVASLAVPVRYFLRWLRARAKS